MVLFQYKHIYGGDWEDDDSGQDDSWVFTVHSGGYAYYKSANGARSVHIGRKITVEMRGYLESESYDLDRLVSFALDGDDGDMAEMVILSRRIMIGDEITFWTEQYVDDMTDDWQRLKDILLNIRSILEKVHIYMEYPYGCFFHYYEKIFYRGLGIIFTSGLIRGLLRPVFVLRSKLRSFFGSLIYIGENPDPEDPPVTIERLMKVGEYKVQGLNEAGAADDDVRQDLFDNIESFKTRKAQLEKAALREHFDYHKDDEELDLQIDELRERIRKAIKDYISRGYDYEKSDAELVEELFDQNTMHISRIALGICGPEGLYKVRIITFDGEKIVQKDLMRNGREKKSGEYLFGGVTKSRFLEAFRHIYIGEWGYNYYNPGTTNGVQWQLVISFDNGVVSRECKGNGSFPYSFKRLYTLMQMGK